MVPKYPPSSARPNAGSQYRSTSNGNRLWLVGSEATSTPNAIGKGSIIPTASGHALRNPHPKMKLRPKYAATNDQLRQLVK